MQLGRRCTLHFPSQFAGGRKTLNCDTPAQRLDMLLKESK